MISRFALSCLLMLLFAPAAFALPGAPMCPDDAKIELYIIPHARSGGAPCDCETFARCVNLNKKPTRLVAQFFNTVIPATQIGSDAALSLGPGSGVNLATSTPPLGIAAGVFSAVISGNHLLTGRVCAASSKIACDAFLSCSCTTGPVFTSLRLIRKKQKGD